MDESERERPMEVFGRPTGRHARAWPLAAALVVAACASTAVDDRWPWTEPTPWTALQDTPTPEPAATPQALLERVRRLASPDPVETGPVESGVRMEAESEEEATGTVEFWNLPDDAIAGHEIRLRMRRGEGGWRVASAEERYHCRRGVTEERSCL